MRYVVKSAAVAAVVGVFASASSAALVYRNTFAGSGVPATTPGGGTLAIRNGFDPVSMTNGTGAFSAVGGIDGNGAYVANNSYAFAGGSSIASTTVTGGTNITTSNVPGTGLQSSLGQFTVSFWLRTNNATTNGTQAGQFGRTFILGSANIGDQGATSASLSFRDGRLDVNVNGRTVQAVGNVIAPDVWNFIALTYDGTSASAFNSSVQNQATNFASATNAQLYEGTNSTAVARFPVGVASTVDNVSNAGPVALGTMASLLVGNRNSDLNRGTAGLFDDIRIYDTVLTPGEIEAIRLSVVPEPASLAALALGGLVLRRRRA